MDEAARSRQRQLDHAAKKAARKAAMKQRADDAEAERVMRWPTDEEAWRSRLRDPEA